MSANCTVSNCARRFITILTVTLFTCTLYSSAYGLQAVQAPPKKHFLWSVESGKNTIYLLGSMHLLKRDAYPLPDTFERIYASCGTVVFETDIGAANEPSFQKKMIARAGYPAGQTLKQNLSAETYRQFEEKMMKSGYSVSKLDWAKPWYGALLLTALEFNRLGYDSKYGIDHYFFNRAKREKKQLIFLESNEYQINIYAGLNKRQQELFLRQILKELEIIEGMASDMVHAWQTGDTGKLNSIIKMSFDNYPGLYNRIMIQRNKRWMSTIGKLMKQNDDVLVIVGAGHLVGRDSVIDLLTRKGYKVRQR